MTAEDTKLDFYAVMYWLLFLSTARSIVNMPFSTFQDSRPPDKEIFFIIIVFACVMIAAGTPIILCAYVVYEIANVLFWPLRRILGQGIVSRPLLNHSLLTLVSFS